VKRLPQKGEQSGKKRKETNLFSQGGGEGNEGGRYFLSLDSYRSEDKVDDNNNGVVYIFLRKRKLDRREKGDL